jgi:hypothetical protein
MTRRPAEERGPSCSVAVVAKNILDSVHGGYTKRTWFLQIGVVQFDD